mgnify:CR=1 FL=1
MIKGNMVDITSSFSGNQLVENDLGGKWFLWLVKVDWWLAIFQNIWDFGSFLWAVNKHVIHVG